MRTCGGRIAPAGPAGGRTGAAVTIGTLPARADGTGLPRGAPGSPDRVESVVGIRRSGADGHRFPRRAVRGFARCGEPVLRGGQAARAGVVLAGDGGAVAVPPDGDVLRAAVRSVLARARPVRVALARVRLLRVRRGRVRLLRPRRPVRRPLRVLLVVLGSARARLVRARLVRARLVRARLVRARLVRARLVRARLVRARLVRARLAGVGPLRLRGLVRTRPPGVLLLVVGPLRARLGRVRLAGFRLARFRLLPRLALLLRLGPVGRG
ncbi:pentapeptide repeat-containing protein [Pseudonocardia nigra]|uniref:pentapeptide repeat-containing protein n=1 Tax=Pseudonocardia nigra TaxID=1921578 RepID=UPI001C5EC4B3